jgi:hypothetical protein
MSDEDVAIEVDPSHFLFLRKVTRTGCLTVLTALKETVSPDFVLNLTRVGLAMVLVERNWTLLLAMALFYHREGTSEEMNRAERFIAQGHARLGIFLASKVWGRRGGLCR